VDVEEDGKEDGEDNENADGDSDSKQTEPP
jgi:hypothetical protein